jgi:carbonic anhydrase
MPVTDELLYANESYADRFEFGHLAMPPARKLAIVACMDARLTVEHALGLKTGDAHIIRNAGGIVTEDVIRSLIISHHLLGTEEFLVINHTDCGMLTFSDDGFREQLRQKTGAATESPTQFHCFTDLRANVLEQLEKIRNHPWLPDGIPVRGFVYDVKSGRLSEVGASVT